MACKVLVVTAALGSLLCQAAGARPRHSDTLSVTVSVFNDAQVPPRVLLTARERAETVFSQAGIALTWLNCDVEGHRATDIGCTGVNYPTHLSVRVAKDGTYRSKDTFGESFLDDHGQGSYASVYTASLASSKSLGVLSEGELLGYVVAHELGHLLLGKDAHSPEGVMRPVWQFEDLQQAARGRLRFTSSQIKRMRAACLQPAALDTATAEASKPGNQIR